MKNKLDLSSNKKLILLDGSTGTMLQKMGMPSGGSPEGYCLEHPEIIRKIQAEYIESGSEVIYTPTFGANRIKLRDYGLEKQVADINQRLAELSLETAHSQGRWAAGNVGPTGIFYQPYGEAGLDQGLEIFSEQIRALDSAGVDLIVIETQIDIQEARIALMAAKQAASRPVIISMTFDESGKTLTGSDPLTCMNILQSLGADGFGFNCSAGPQQMLEMVKNINAYARIPILVKPNAGLPVVEKGKTLFSMGPEEFSGYGEAFREAGVSLLGGCCGTTPEHIRVLNQRLKHKTRIKRFRENNHLLLSSPRKTMVIACDPEKPIRVVGERINPTGKAELQDELKAGKLEILKTYAKEQKENGADILDVNVGMPGIREKDVMLKVVSELAVFSDLPLCIDSDQPEVIEAAARLYPGRILVNSISGEAKKLAKLLPVIRQYGAAFIILPLDEDGIAADWEGRQKVLERVLAACERHGIPRENAVVDGLVLAVSANPGGLNITLRTISYASRELGLNTILGLSNISFGLPGREFLNSAFLAMAASAGLSLVIANPMEPLLMKIKRSSEVLIGRDEGAREFINQCTSKGAPESRAKRHKIKAEVSLDREIYETILQGEKTQIRELVQAGLKKGLLAYDIVQKIMIPAIQIVGEKYDQREYFLPQLIASAETMEKGMQCLMPYLKQENQGAQDVGILATVKGDVHDIGKKIVGLLLRNNGYKIVDLGKSVDENTILIKAIENKAKFIALSALMTTTMLEMEKVVSLVRRRGLGIPVILGGAVVTQQYAEEIGADGYASDAVKCVELVKRLLKQRK